eukprot:CAMPEP_0178890692 /NCGR_PEP_ID=MMETSP0747-20121128/18483_1 /TAXON_ID=913974 /ORGANISM="Nitzschia punctata, Strain CCMP561" /LENGTH=97 /DNA_ID=CAMNT_0020560371 /DNA_START=129 /DNA_END=419 /DNA_ORIENTATION=+
MKYDKLSKLSDGEDDMSKNKAEGYWIDSRDRDTKRKDGDSVSTMTVAAFCDDEEEDEELDLFSTDESEAEAGIQTKTSVYSHFRHSSNRQHRPLPPF